MKTLQTIIDHAIGWAALVIFVACMLVEFVVTYEESSNG